MDHLQEFQRCRPLLFSIAYRMLGSASDAEDILQDAWLRFARAGDAEVRSAKGYLTTIVTRLCLDHLKSARVSREQYVGPWLPEPILTEGDAQPEQSAVLAESLTLAFMVLLDTLSPDERAVFLLREIFEYSYAEIAEMLGSSEANCRQLFHRARQRVAAREPRSSRPYEEKQQLAERFARALRDGDGDALASVLAADVGFWGDGGGKVPATGRPVYGRPSVLNLLLGIRRVAAAMGVTMDDVGLQVREVNREPAILVRVRGQLNSVYTFTMRDDAISVIRVIRNPDKLGFIDAQLSGGVSSAPLLAPGP
ncbi:MAG TPA: RNA polymerase sigma-70 factor [Vicinamibacterales bacterium]|nr:RNA polymerase sigma-70 factor [Vicinamibacterales bacterium]